MTKVVQFTSVHPWNDVRVFLKECRTLAAHGYDTTLVAAGAEDQTVDGVKIVGVGRSRNRLARMLFTAPRVTWRAWRQRGDIYHFHDPELIPWAMLLSLLGRKKVVYDVHEDLVQQTLHRVWIHKWLRRPIASIVRAIEYVGVTCFDHVFAATPFIGGLFPRHKATVLQNFPIIGELANDEELERDPATFVYVGVLSRERGLIEMIRAIDRLEGTPNKRLVLAGTISPPGLLEVARAEPGWRYVTYLGQVSRAEVSEVIATAAAGLVVFHPAGNHINAQPNKLFEYMSAGLPIIASDFPLWRELISGGDTGLLVDPLDPAAIAAAMKQISEDPAAARQLGGNGQVSVLGRFNWTAEKTALLEVYAKLA